MKKLFSLCLMSMAMATMSAAEVPFTVTPADGAVIDSFTSMVLELTEDSGFADFEVVSRGDIYFTLNGEYYSGVTRGASEGNPLEFMPAEAIITPGEYQFVIEVGALGWWSADYSNYAENSEKLVYNFTIAGETGEESEPAELPFVLSPEEGSTVSELSTITISLKPDTGYEYIDISSYDVSVLNADYEKCGKVSVYQAPSDITSYTLTLTDEEGNYFTKPGDYVLAFNEYAVSCGNEDGNLFYINLEPLLFTYTVAETPAEVQYDVIPSSYRPADGAVIDLEERDFESVTLNVGEGIMPAEYATAWIIPVDAPEEAVEAKIEKVKYMNQLICYFNAMQYSGDYEVYIPEGSFGDEAWLENPQHGHTNPEISVTYTLINGKERESAVSYSLVPEIAYTDNHQTFTLTFEEGVMMNPYAFATFRCEEARYSKYAEFVDNGNSAFTVTFDEAPSEPGNYVFFVERGLFGNDEFINSDEKAGIANEEIAMVIEVTASGITSVSIEAAKKGVYNLNGVKMADSTENLPAGLYIVDGKKVLVK